MKFTLINPGRVISANNIWRLVNSVSPPLGLATLAAILEAAGHEVRIIDAAALNLSISQVQAAVPEDVDFVGFTATTPEIGTAATLARAVREKRPRAQIMLGGVHATVFHQDLIHEETWDLVLRGEGELPIQALAAGQPLAAIPGLTWKTASGEVRVNPEAKTLADLNALPSPAYHLLPMERYRSGLGAAKKQPSIGMITSRGCHGRCTFCYSGMFGTKTRWMSPEKIIAEIGFLRSQHGIREISFYDDTFTANRPRVEKICALLRQRQHKVSWSCFTRVDAVTPDLLKLMKEAGCHQVAFGLESADEEVLRAINKGAGSTKAARAVAWVRQAGLDARGSFIIGSPGETTASLRKTIEFSKKIGLRYALYNIMTPFPGTALYQWAQEQGLLRHTDWDLYDLAHPVLALPALAPETLQSYYYQAYREFYLRPAYILSSLLHLRSRFAWQIHRKAFLGILGLLLKGQATGTPGPDGGRPCV